MKSKKNNRRSKFLKTRSPKDRNQLEFDLSSVTDQSPDAGPAKIVSTKKYSRRNFLVKVAVGILTVNLVFHSESSSATEVRSTQPVAAASIFAFAAKALSMIGATIGTAKVKALSGIGAVWEHAKDSFCKYLGGLAFAGFLLVCRHEVIKYQIGSEYWHYFHLLKHLASTFH
jgi:hypothetical protein